MYFKSLKMLSLLLLFFFSAKSQRSNIVIGPELNLPTGNATNQSPIGFGGYLKAELGISEKFSLTGSGAIASFIGKRILGPRQPTMSYIPIKAGLKYYTDGDFYFEGQVGASLPLNGNGKTAFIWSPGVGSFIRSRNSSNQFDVGLRYESWVGANSLNSPTSKGAAFNFFSLRVGYAFNL